MGEAKRYFLAGALAVSLGLTVVIPTAAKQVTITWSTFLGGDLLQEEKELIQIFEKENPNIKVKIINAGYEQLLAMHAAGKPPDVMHTLLDWGDELIRRNMILDVTKYFKASDFDFNQYVKFSPNYIRNGKIIGGLETHNQVYPLYYNATQFKQAGLPSPNEMRNQNAWKWANFLETAKRLTSDTNGDGKPDRWGFWFENYWEHGWFSWLAMNDTNFYDRKKNQVILDSPKAIEAMDFLSSLPLKHRVAPAFATVGDSGFMQGKFAMMIHSTWMINRLRNTKLSFDWDIAHAPRGLTDGSLLSPGSDGIISKATKHPTEAFKLVKFFLSSQCQMAKARSRLVVPVMKQALNSKEYQSAPPVHMKIVPEIIEYSTPNLLFPGFAEVQGVINSEVYKMMQGKKSVDIAMKDATTQSNKILARYAARNK